MAITNVKKLILYNKIVNDKIDAKQNIIDTSLITTAKNIVPAINELKSVNDTQNTSISTNATNITNVANNLSTNYTNTTAMNSAIATATSGLATTSALTSGLAGKMNIDCSNMNISFTGGFYKFSKETTPSGIDSLSVIDGSSGFGTVKNFYASNFEMAATNFSTLADSMAVSKSMMVSQLALKENILIAGQNTTVTHSGNNTLVNVPNLPIWTTVTSQASGRVLSTTLVLGATYRVTYNWTNGSSNDIKLIKTFIWNGNSGRIDTCLISVVAVTVVGISVLGSINTLGLVANSTNISIVVVAGVDTTDGNVFKLERLTAGVL